MAITESPAADQPRYGSRKFITTHAAMGQGTLILLATMIWEPPAGFFDALGSYFLLLAAGITAYQLANAYVTGKGNGAA